jgi:hypothetical protein
MAFGNYPHNPKQIIDFDKLHVVPVVTTFNTEGKIRPDYFGFTNPDGSVEKFKIETVKYTREYDNPSRILFCCSYKNYGKLYEVNLVYYIRECRWTIG